MFLKQCIFKNLKVGPIDARKNIKNYELSPKQYKNYELSFPALS